MFSNVWYRNLYHILTSVIPAQGRNPEIIPPIPILDPETSSELALNLFQG